ncbi:glycosyltransferase family 4 protein [Thiovibrio frasassiensis]|uniref:Glycosyltransferase family 4 protein n=1 Tax=Thiovibrio frasassiensis TaxID=2984131 RepID=A0A9X4MP51_9BACT|nr:glycosyltransferase family 4 protein [Thiovibrio frasassiensis]MDG4476297.1 glycosyltransferase family 4 protein [Thiovibrio frasassiensis]
MSPVKKIALALENFSRYGGGAESYAVSLADRLMRNGWEVHFFGERWDGEPGGAIFHRISIPAFLPAWAKLLLFALKHKRMVADRDFDVILGFGNTIVMNVYQSHGGVHWLTTYRKVYSEINPAVRFIKRLLIPLTLKHYVRHWIESAPFRMARLPRIVAISEMVRDDYVAYYGVSPEQVDLVYNGVDPERFTAQRTSGERNLFRAAFGIQESEVVFLFVSYDLEKKGIIPLLHAVAQLRKQGGDGFRLMVVGGLPSSRIERLVAKLGVQEFVCFAGPKKDVHHVFAASDVLVLPTYYDTCSLVVFEAMMSGLPVITTFYNGAAGIIDNGKDGFVVSHPPDSAEIASKMALLLDKEFRNHMAVLAVQKGNEYPLAKNHEQLIGIFDEVAEKHR